MNDKTKETLDKIKDQILSGKLTPTEVMQWIDMAFDLGRCQGTIEGVDACGRGLGLSA